jgi:hypothetical protein
LTKPSATPWRRNHTVLVTDAHTMAGIGVIRSLGRAGYRVVAGAPDRRALGLRSRLASERLVCPAPTAEQFVPWCREVARSRRVSAIVPLEAALRALLTDFTHFGPLLPYASDAATIRVGLSKCDLFAALARDKQPSGFDRVLIIDDTTSAPSCAELADWPLPIFIKVDAIHARNGAPSRNVRADGIPEALNRVVELRRDYHRLLMQPYAAGVGVGAFFIMKDGAPIAEFMHERLHEVPHTGGISSLRATFDHSAIRAHALAVLRTIGWEGVAMLEYRWDRASDRFTLMEMNPRFWGSLHLALYAGVDFPRLLIDTHLGHAPLPTSTPPRRIRCRHTFPGEVQHVWSRWCDRQVPWSGKLASVGRAIALSCDPRVRSDLGFPGDRLLYWRNLVRTLGQVSRDAVRRLMPARPMKPCKLEGEAPTSWRLAKRNPS